MLRCELNQHREAYQRDVLHFIGRENWSKYLMIAKCTCPNEGQDALYGNGQRVMNKTSKDGMFRCSSCAKDHNVGGVKKK